MNSIKRQAASKARQNRQQQGDSTRSLSADEKLSCDFSCPCDDSKGSFCVFAHISTYEWAAEGLSSGSKARPALVA